MAKNPAEIAHGPMLIGTVLNILLFGIMIAQTYLYFTTYKRDRVWMKLFVLTVFIADTLNTVFDCIFLYESTILNFGDFESLKTANWRFATDPAMTGIIELLVQLFFAWRILILTKNKPLVAVVVVLAITAGVCAIVTTYEVIIIPEFIRFQEFANVVIVWLSCASAADIMITSILVWYLRKHKTGFRSSDMIVDRIIRVTVQTGLLTSVIAIVDLIVYLVDPTGTHLIFNFPLCKLYSNSLISSLNSRGGWKYRDNSDSRDPTESRMAPDKSMIASQMHDEPQSGWKDTESISYVSRVAQSITPGHARKTSPTMFTGTRSKNKPKQEVFVHVESHELRDVSSPHAKSGGPHDGHGVIGRAPIVTSRPGVVMIPAGGFTDAKDPSFDSDSENALDLSTKSGPYGH